MGLISKTVMVKWVSSNKQYYIKQGYKFTKMGDEFEVKIEDLTKGSNIRVDWLCDGCKSIVNTKYINYNENYNKHDGKVYCTNCVFEMFSRKTILNKSRSFEQWCLENDRKDILNIWDYELNKYSPNEINYGSSNRCWFKCNKHPEHGSFSRSLESITKNKNTDLVHQCKKCNSLAQWFMDNNLNIDDYWDYEKNIIDPWEISYGSSKKVWFKCVVQDYHGSYKATLNSFTRGKRCPFCRGLKVHSKDSLGQYIIDNYGEEFLNKIWSEKNKKSPFEYMPMSSKKVWWKCLDDEHEDFCKSVQHLKVSEFRCPKCVRKNRESILEEKVRLYLESLDYTILHEYSCNIVPKNPKTKMLLPFDNEIKELKLIIEVHGGQHYNIINNGSKWLDGLTPKEYLHKRKLYDRYKRIYAIQNGYNYLEIPYNTIFDSKETYKQMIDDKIKEILNKNY